MLNFKMKPINGWNKNNDYDLGFDITYFFIDSSIMITILLIPFLKRRFRHQNHTPIQRQPENLHPFEHHQRRLHLSEQ